MLSHSALIARLDALAIQTISMDAYIDGTYGDDYNDILSKLMSVSQVGKLVYAEFALPTDSWRQLPSSSVGKQVNAARLRSKIAQLSAVLKTQRETFSNKSLKIEYPLNSSDTITFYFADSELDSRCRDLINAHDHYDRAVNQATLILENRIKGKFPEYSEMNGLPLISKLINPDPTKTRILISEIGSEQEGFANLFKGIIGAYRNTTHHKIEAMEKRRAIQICGFIDNLLEAIELSQIVRVQNPQINDETFKG